VPGKYASFAELASHEFEGVDDLRGSQRRASLAHAARAAIAEYVQREGQA
jgi:hypothetical protein